MTAAIRVHDPVDPLHVEGGHYWVKTSTLILADPRIGDGPKITLIAITSLADSRGVIHATVKQIAAARGGSWQTVERHIRALETLGAITREGSGPDRTICLNFGFRQPRKPGINPIKSEGVKPPEPPSNLQDQPLKFAGRSPQICGQPPSRSRGLIKIHPEESLTGSPSPDGEGSARHRHGPGYGAATAGRASEGGRPESPTNGWTQDPAAAEDLAKWAMDVAGNDPGLISLGLAALRMADRLDLIPEGAYGRLDRLKKGRAGATPGRVPGPARDDHP